MMIRELSFAMIFIIIIDIIKKVYLRSKNDGDDVPGDAHRLQIGSVVFVIRHKDKSSFLVMWR